MNNLPFLYFLIFLLIGFLLTPQTLTSYSFDQIYKEINNKDWQVRLAGVEKAGKINNKKTTEILLEIAASKGEYWPVKIRAIELLGERADPIAIQVLLDIYNDIFLHSECPSIKSYTAIALGNFKSNENIVNALIEGIDDSELLIRESSIISLGKIGNPKAVEPLVRKLRDKSFAIRFAALRALIEIGDKRAFSSIEEVALRDEDPVLREYARSALLRLK
ncbi:MAG: HEAT repeat domain-containing protein [Thermodesulfovibrionales bacterium]|nr:HEAT repeat domain-containing protein [Thermodesulfovibrionales bacterium]